jgi:hypothetical protein
MVYDVMHPELLLLCRRSLVLGLRRVPDPDAKPPEPAPANLARPTCAGRKAN